jgi:hypothetical protein
MGVFDVNTDKAIVLTAKLEKLHRSAFPVAVRGTLNDAAFKTKELVPKAAGLKFTIRQKKLFSVFTGVNQATGFHIQAMESQTGIVRKSGADKLTKGLETQETGGSIEGRKLVPHYLARIGNSHLRKVRKKHHFNNIEIQRLGSRKKKAKYITIKKGGGKSKATVFNVENGQFTPVYTHRKSNVTRLRKRPFLRPSSLVASRKMDNFYIERAEQQFNRLLK